MRKLLFLCLIFMPRPCFSSVPESPILAHSDADEEREFQNVYQAIKNPTIQTATISTATISSLTVSTATITNSLTVNGVVASFHFLQVVGCINNSQTITTSSTYANSNLTCQIKPSSASSKIIIVVTSVLQVNSATTLGHESLKRGTTELSTNGGGFAIWRSGSNASQNSATTATFAVFDSPGVTTTLTYTMCMRNDDNSTTVANSIDFNTEEMILMEVQ